MRIPKGVLVQKYGGSSLSDAENIKSAAARIGKTFSPISGKEVKSDKIGKMVMNKLKKLDKVAYIRFASVYMDFRDIKDFKEVKSEV